MFTFALLYKGHILQLLFLAVAAKHQVKSYFHAESIGVNR